MRFKKKYYIFFTIIFIIMFSFFNKTYANYDKLIYNFTIDSINGEKIDFSKFKNKAILIVNVASKCGFTKQYDDLQNLWDNYKDVGLVVVGFPSNQFGGQEPGTSSEIKNFCETNFNINFPLTIKIDVKGNNIEPIYKWAQENYGKSAIPKWNFHKILLNKEGKIQSTYASFVNPKSKTIIAEIEKILELKN